MKLQNKTIHLPDIIGGGYGDFWQFKGRYRVCKGSRASKKSKTTALWFIYNMMRYPDSNTLVVRKTFATLRDSCYSDLQWATYRLGVNHLWDFTTSPLYAIYKPTGQRIFFRGLDDPMKLTSIAVPKGYLCWVWIEEAYEIDNEADFDMLDESIRGAIAEPLFKQITITFNPWSESHWLKKRFFDTPSDDVLAKTTNYKCNEWLDEADKKKFDDMKQNNPKRYKVAGLGDWGIDGGQVFDEFVDDPEHYEDRLWTHVIKPFEPPKSWRIYRSFDFGYSKPFSASWTVFDGDLRAYRILELYGCVKGESDVGVKWTPGEIFAEMERIEKEHPWLAGRHIYGVADPAIWDKSHGKSIAEIAAKYGIYFDKGNHNRLQGLMQMHERLKFDENGIPMFYVFSNCKALIRTLPLLVYDENKPEDVLTSQEDHAYDECRYLMMLHPIEPIKEEKAVKIYNNPLEDKRRYERFTY